MNETVLEQVWIADSSEHMIHFNGYKFLEIHK